MKVVSPQLVQHHSVYGGTAYGPRQRLLIEAQGSRLMFVPGHTAYISRASGSRYSAATLWLVRDDMALTRRTVMKLEGVRLSEKLLKSIEVQQAVAAMYGEAVAQALRPDVTIVLDSNESRCSTPEEHRNTQNTNTGKL